MEGSKLIDFRESLLSDLHYLYDRSLSDVAAFESDLKATDLSASDVLKAHFAVVDYFLRRGEGEGIGGYGPKDTGLLISALSRQFVSYEGVDKWNTVPEKAATLLFGLVQNHPFYDANKRTAYLSTVHYLYQNGLVITVSEKALEDMTVLVAKNGLGKFPRFRDLMKKGGDPEVRFLAHYLRQNTRTIDRQQYLVTYRELEKILKRYGVWLGNPHNNQIDVMRLETVTKTSGVFGRKTQSKEVRKVCTLGFPGWTRQVGKGRLAHVRKALDLVPEKGVDSQSFFKEVDDMRVLIEMYEGALHRLAYR